jgi:hypothetical protein
MSWTGCRGGGEDGASSYLHSGKALVLGNRPLLSAGTVSDDFHRAFVEARNLQLLRNDARRIRTKVDEARNNPSDAGARWPFELLQNAYDAGPRHTRDCVTIALGWEATPAGFRVWFQHDAAPFAPQDIAALLSGGSSKEFESETTTGRFGTGFLSTHVLSLQVRVGGLLEVDGRLAYFSIPLDRAGNEDAIAQNGAEAAEALRGVEDAPVEDGAPSARFEWDVVDLQTYARGVAALEIALPFVFGTCPLLAKVEIRAADGGTRTWEASPPRPFSSDSLAWVERDLSSAGIGMSVIRVGGAASASSTSALFCSRDGDVVPLPAGVARLFLRFPLRGTAALPIRLVLDGPFVVDSERSRVSVTRGGGVITEALRIAVSAVLVALTRRDAHAHLLAAAGSADSIGDSGERAWWNQELGAFASACATLPLVASRDRNLPVLSSEDYETYADFPLRRMGETPGPHEVDLEPVRALMDAAEWCDPPVSAVAADWDEIVGGWTALGVDVSRLAISKICGQARQGRTTWEALAAHTGGRELLPAS